MKISVSGLGKISGADISFDGLTVIAGENDTGKSTIGKLIFSIVKALSRYEQDLNESKIKQVFREIEDIYFRLRRYGGANEKKMNLLRSHFFPPRFSDELQRFFGNQLMLFENSSDVDFQLFFERKVEALKELEVNEDILTYSIESLNRIKNTVLFKEDINEVIKRALGKAFVSEFYFELSPKRSPLTNSKVSITEGNELLFEFSVSNNKISSIRLGEKIGFDDATLIDSPILLQMSDLIQGASTLFELESEQDKAERLNLVNRPKVPLHQKDLISKIKEAEYFAFDSSGVVMDNPEKRSRHSSLIRNINRVINGVFSYEKESRDFIYTVQSDSGPESKIRSLNTASGLKSFGILQLLAISNRLDERSLIIIDEPETHLHPKWQIEYARLLVELVKNNCYLLITTHSPYFLQAIKVFSDRSGVKDRVNYYLAETSSDGAVLRNVNDDLNSVFKKLSDPLQEIVWEK